MPRSATLYIPAISWQSVLLVKETGVPRENYHMVWLVMVMISNATISYIVYFSYIMAVSVIGEGNWSIQRKLPHGLIGHKIMWLSG
jgi:hypothetical protein